MKMKPNRNIMKKENKKGQQHFNFNISVYYDE